MRISINKSRVKGRVLVPSSKSYTIRALMCAARAAGQSEILRPLAADDTLAALRVLRGIGVKIEEEENLWRVWGGKYVAPSGDLFCGDSAATLRFMTAVCTLVPGQSRLTAGTSLAGRPVNPLVEALRGWGADVYCEGAFPPVTVKGAYLRGGNTGIAGDISSQFISALLLVAAAAERETSIKLISLAESRSYILMTLECLRKFGIEIGHDDNLGHFTALPQTFQPARYEVEGDWSSASYIMALGAVCGETVLSGLNIDSLQGDRAIVKLLQAMQAELNLEQDTITTGQSALKAVRVDLNECIDLWPTMAVLAALSEGTSEFSGITRARLKESDRIMSVKQGLLQAGIKVEEDQDRLKITGGPTRQAVIDPHNDHRIAMAFAVMGASRGGIVIDGAECVSKTFPQYWNFLRKLGVDINEQ